MSRDKQVMTVLGSIPPKNLGKTLPHEHLFIDLRFIIPKEKRTDSRVSIKNLHALHVDYTSITDNLYLNSIRTAIDEVELFKKFGGGSIVDVSSIGAGRKPLALQTVSQATQVNIVMGSGFYIQQSLKKAITEASEISLTKKLIRECRYGYRNSGIRPGIIGEIGISPFLNEWDKKSLRIASSLQKETQLPISIHIQAVPILKGFSKPNGLEVVGILEKLGANLEKVVIGHTDALIDLNYLRKLIATGVYIELDHFGKDFYFPQTNFLMSRDMDRVKAIQILISEHHIQKILISTDICLKQDLTCNGGHGYVHILETVVQMMLNNGISEQDVETLMTTNVQNLLAIDSCYL